MGFPSRVALLATLVCGLGLSTGPASASTSEELSAQIPQGWVKARQNTLANMSTSEWVPADTAGEWRQKITLEAMQVGDLPDPLEFVQGLAESQREACSDFADNAVFAGFENGYPTAVHILECGKNKRTQRPLLTMVKAIRGNTAFYTITRIWRLQNPPSQLIGDTGTLPIDQAEVAAWAATLKDFRLCDGALDAHPCNG